jgi:NADPH:quinone reductase-like Zn-dependent oxidoreductase
MKAVRFHDYGGVDVLHYEEVDRPTPSDGQVLLKVAGAAFNPIDTWIRAGQLVDIFPVSLPHTPGIDVAGTVVEIGDAVTGVRVGENVIGLLPIPGGGAMADFALAPAQALTSAPESVPLPHAAALPVAALTAWQALFEHADLRAGQTVLVNGAGGGVGGYVVQLAKQVGASVIATASPRSSQSVNAYGADRVIDYTERSLRDAITEPVDAVINLVVTTEPAMSELIGLIRSRGILVTATAPAADDPTSRVRIVFFPVRSDAGQLADIVKQVDAGALQVDVSAVHPLVDVALIHTSSAANEIRGKVILVPEG